MNLQKIMNQLTIDEGKKLKVYRCSMGLPTVGIGHLVLPEDNLKVGDLISEERCAQLFEQDLNNALTECRKLLSNFDSMPDPIQETLVNMMFNLGPNRLAKFKLFFEALQKKNYKEAALQMRNSRWYKQVGNRAARLAAIVENQPV